MKREPFTSTVVSGVSVFSSSASSSSMRSKWHRAGAKRGDGLFRQIAQRQQSVCAGGARCAPDFGVHRRGVGTEFAHVAEHQHLAAGLLCQHRQRGFHESGLAL